VEGKMTFSDLGKQGDTGGNSGIGELGSVK
jgi:hypothetical protein